MEQRFTLLFQKYVTRTASLPETEEFWLMVNNSRNHDLLIKLIDGRYAAFGEIDDTLKSKAVERILDHVFSSDTQHTTIDPPIIPLYRKWQKMAIAAAVAAIIFGAGLFYFNGYNRVNTNTITYKNDVNPGVQGATLTLANGKKIRLTDAVNGKLAEESGVTITKSANGKLVYDMKGSSTETNKINTLSTANGETFELHLPDGSSVWLNSASSLTYIASLNEKGKRVVRLIGEAYFQIAKDKKHPFVVRTAKQDVEVLGTHFNINSYADELAVATTLVEGSVKVTSGSTVKMLKPGEQAMNNGTTVNIQQADVENITDWKDGDFFLDGVDFKIAMRKIARWYDVEVIYDVSVTDHIRSGGWISRNNPLSAVLKSIEASGQVHFNIVGRKIYVTK